MSKQVTPLTLTDLSPAGACCALAVDAAPIASKRANAAVVQGLLPPSLKLRRTSRSNFMVVLRLVRVSMPLQKNEVKAQD